MPALERAVQDISKKLDRTPAERKETLRGIAEYIAEKARAGEKAKLTFICTHNSRRSHMSQIWAQAFAHRAGFGHVETFSGGTEATVFNPRAVKALRDIGFSIPAPEESGNPHYSVQYAESAPAVEAFSKKYSDEFNPQEGFLAVMTCSDADEACPVVFGAEARISIPYEDPKKYDGTDREERAYAERSMQIAAEMYYVLSEARKLAGE
ncbi:MAG: protein-tyrosine-phosphatase [Ectothiorhodospiraceae bacterium]|nr:protein-tyrosine-phosphatase [Ectothiorhodospiraceae bacterium]